MGKWCWLGLVAFGLLGLQTAAAQLPEEPRRSYVEIPLPGRDASAIRDRLRRAEDLSRVQQIVDKYRFNPKGLANDTKAIQDLARAKQDGVIHIDPNDPALAVWKNFLGKQDWDRIEKQLPPDQVKAIRDLVGTQPPSGGPGTGPGGTGPQGGGPPRPPGTGTAGGPRPPETHAPPPPGGAPPGQPGAGAPPRTPPPPSPQARADAEARRADAEMWQSLLKGFQKYGGPLVDTPAFRETLRNLDLSKWGRPTSADSRGKSWEERFAGMVRSAGQSRFWSGANWPALANLSLPKFPYPNLPEMRFSFGHVPVVSVPHVRPVAVGPPSPRAGVGLLWVALLAVACFVLWRVLLDRTAARAARREEDDWKLGPWPVDPATVATREDLVRAFEYLSLLKFGRRARSWNHREVAAGLAAEDGEAAGERRRAADHLADLYERARYAPGAEPLADDDLGAARRELLLLAGVNGA